MATCSMASAVFVQNTIHIGKVLLARNVRWANSVQKRSGTRSAISSGILSYKLGVNGVRLHFETTGHGNHCILLLPGALGSSRTDFGPQLKSFNKHDFTLFALDPRGYGKSIPPTRDWPLHFLQRDAEDCMELIRKLGIDKVSIMGWSNGGNAAMIAAARYPERVKKLIVWGANAYITKEDQERLNRKYIRDVSAWSEKKRSPFLALYGENYFREQWSNMTDAFNNYCIKCNGDLFKDDLPNIRAETLIIHGLKDALVPLEHPDYLHRNIKRSRFYIMVEGKHNVHIAHHREFNFLAEQFLKS